MDDVVASGNVPIRAAAVAQMLDRARRRVSAERDAAVYAADADASDLDDLAIWVATRPTDID